MENNRSNLLIKNLLLYFLLLSIYLIGNFSFIEFEKLSFNVNFWIRDSYLLNYFDYGFLKRGLIGTLLGIRVSDVEIIRPDRLVSESFQNFINLISVIVITITITLYLIVLNKISNEYKKILIILAISPFAFINFGYDAGRFDQFTIIYFLTFFIFLKNKNITNYLIVISPFFLFVQETNLFLLSSFIFFYTYFFNRNVYLISYLILANLLILFILFFYGDADYNNTNYIWPLHAYFDSSKTFIEKIFYWWERLLIFNTTIIYRHFFAIIVFIIFNYLLIRKFEEINKIKKFISSTFIFYTIILIVAIDHARYVSNYIFIMVLFIVVHLSENKNIKLTIPSNYYYSILLAGPFGVTYSLPYLTILKKIILNID